MSGSSAKILVVDDDAAIRVLLTAVLAREGFRPDVAENGQQAIDRLMKATYDAILLDLMMPVKSGLDVIEYLELHSAETISGCLIVLTAASDRDLKQIDGKPVFRVLRKPFDLTELVTTVHACVRREANGEGGSASSPSA